MLGELFNSFGNYGMNWFPKSKAKCRKEEKKKKKLVCFNFGLNEEASETVKKKAESAGTKGEGGPHGPIVMGYMGQRRRPTSRASQSLSPRQRRQTWPHL